MGKVALLDLTHYYKRLETMSKIKKIKLDTKERSASDRYEILPYTQGMATETLELGEKKYPWGAQGAIHVKDGGEAQALQEKYDGRVITMKVQSPDIHDRGHRYFFGGWPEMPWKRKVKDGETETEEEKPREGSDEVAQEIEAQQEQAV